MERKRLQCLRCDHVWLSSSEGKPLMCPRCKRRDWRKKDVKPQGKRVEVPFYNR